MTVEAMQRLWDFTYANEEVAKQAGVSPDYVKDIALVASLIDILAEEEHWVNDKQKEPSADWSVSEAILGVVPRTDIQKKVLDILVGLGCESLSEVEGISYVIAPMQLTNIFLIRLKGRKAQLPSQWNAEYTSALERIMNSRGLPLGRLCNVRWSSGHNVKRRS